MTLYEFITMEHADFDTYDTEFDTYKRQGIDKIPTIHEGYAAREIVSKGRTSKRIKINNEIRESNNLLREIADEQKQIESELKELKKKLDGDD